MIHVDRVQALLTPEEVGKELKYGAKTIREWLRVGRLRGIKIGGQWRIRRDELLRFLAEHSD